MARRPDAPWRPARSLWWLPDTAEGYRESEQSWSELLLDLKARGLVVDPKLAVADGALGFWAACRKLWPSTREQRCWVHKTANVLNKLPQGAPRQGPLNPA